MEVECFYWEWRGTGGVGGSCSEFRVNIEWFWWEWRDIGGVGGILLGA